MYTLYLVEPGSEILLNVLILISKWPLTTAPMSDAWSTGTSDVASGDSVDCFVRQTETKTRVQENSC